MIIVVVSLLMWGCSGSIEEALSYNETLVMQYNRVATIEERLIFLVLTEDTAYFDKELKKYITQIQTSDSVIRVLGAYRDYPDFQLAALRMLEVYKSTTPQMEELMAMVRNKSLIELTDSIPFDTLLSHKLFFMDSIIEAEFDTFYMAQEKFAAKFSFRLE